MPINKRVLLAKRPVGEPGDECFKIEEVEVPELGENEILEVAEADGLLANDHDADSTQFEIVAVNGQESQ